MTTWLAGFERLPIVRQDAQLNGGTYVELTRNGMPAPWRLVLHTTEGIATLEAFVELYARTGDYPHITADPVRRRKAQHLDLDRSCTALKNAPGGVETNRLHCVQVELVAMAADADQLDEAALQWIGAEVIAPICAAKGISPTPYAEVGMDGRDGFIARPDGPTRMTLDQWESWAGVCTHQNVPENDHWDCGRLKLGHACAAARFVLAPALHLPSTPIQEDDDMPLTYCQDDRYANVFVEPFGGTLSSLPDGVTVERFHHDQRLASCVWRTWGCDIDAAVARGLLVTA